MSAWRRALGLVLLAGFGVLGAGATSPRWTSGPPYFTTQNSQAVVWYTDTPLYFTDPGDLSPYVNHAAAEAMVAAAANVWNVPTSRLVLQQGGSLNEHVSGTNVYGTPGGLTFPTDVDSTAYAIKQIAVIYDTDGSVTDLLLGGGASDPSGCRQNGVTESVDGFQPSGYIQHAMLILNGRCTGPAPEQQLQMQYQLERMFGRILGVGWSQANDNVFTGTPQPTYAQALHWPIMHPIDVICGPYTYQCLPQPFTLRDDDIASLTFLYPVTNNPGPGKVLITDQASREDGTLVFPSGEGMAGTNVVLRRVSIPQQIPETWDEMSAVSGIFNMQMEGNPITPKPAGVAGSIGALDNYYDLAGYFNFTWIPVPQYAYGQLLIAHTEAINPLYTGQYGIAPYVASTVKPTGDPMGWGAYVVVNCCNYVAHGVQNAPTTCSLGGDGTEDAPVVPPTGGWTTGVFCGTNQSVPWSFRHTSWLGVPVGANRSLTVEVTALDEQGFATATKARPVMGVWHGTDGLGTAPSVAAQAVAFNSVVTGTTTMGAQTTTAETLRIAIAEERGDGRPDYAYRARVMYADTILPVLSTAGAQVTIHGMGFRPGNAVAIGGVTATVSSWTSTTIVATVPFLSSVAAGTTVAEDVAVLDPSTQGTTVMTGALQYVYSAPAYRLVLISGPSTDQPVTLAASPSFSVKAIDSDGLTPRPGTQVVFTMNLGSVSWSGCGAVPSCTVTTGANGIATVVVTPLQPGAVTLQAAALGLTQTVSFQAVPLVRTMAVVPSTVYVATGQTVSYAVSAAATQQGSPAAYTPVTWNVASGPITFSGGQTTTNAAGVATATVTVGPLAEGAIARASACAWTPICGNFVALGVGPPELVVALPSGGGGQTLPATGTLTPTTILITDAGGNPVIGAPVQVYQTVSQWTAPCGVQGRCPIAPILQISKTTLTSDGNGAVTVSPLQVAGPEVTSVVITSGTQGYAGITLQKHP